MQTPKTGSIPGLVIEEWVEAADLDRHPNDHSSSLSFEGALERGVAEIVIALDRLADATLGRWRPKPADSEVENSLGLAGCHCV